MIIGIYGAYGTKNIGDDAILISIITSIKKVIGDTEFIVFSADIKESNKIYNAGHIKYVKASLKRPVTLIKTILKTDILLYGGGGLIYDHHGLKGLLARLSYIILAKILRKPVMIYAIGVGPLITRFGGFLVAIVLNQVDLITTRDKESMKLLKDIGVNKPPMCVTADPALCLPLEDSNVAMEIINKENISIDKMVIGLSIRSLKDKTIGIKVIAQICDELAEAYNAELLFIPMSKHKQAQFANDLYVNEEILKLLKHKESVKIIRGDYNPSEIKSIMGYTDLFIGMRLHSLIFAATMNVPIIGIVYDQKVISFLRLIGQEKQAIDLEHINLDCMVAKAKQVISSKEEIKKDLKTKVTSAQKSSLNTSKLFIKHFSK